MRKKVNSFTAIFHKIYSSKLLYDFAVGKYKQDAERADYSTGAHTDARNRAQTQAPPHDIL